MLNKLFTIVLLIAGFLMIGNSSFAQETELSSKEKRKLEKEEKKKAKASRDAEEVEILKELLSTKFFVFQGSRLRGNGGDTWALTPNINFLSVIDTNVVLQFGFEGLVGWNGVGGITVEGYQVTYEFDDGGDSKSMTVSGQMREKIGHSHVYYVINVRDDGSADLDLTIPGGTFRMSGRIVNPYEAGIFKGEYY